MGERGRSRYRARPCSAAAAMSALIVYCCVPDQDVADRIARSLVEEGLAACVNRLPGVVSTYRWQGGTHVDAELLLLIKTTRARFESLRARIVELHPYELPEVIAVDVALGHEPYLAWVAETTAFKH
jgi:periplasmic divalent cation tolerance protein